MRKTLGLSLILALVLTMSAAAAQAAAPTDEPRPDFTDGRLNAFDAGAPIILYETHASTAAVDDAGNPTTLTFVNGVQVLRWNEEAGNTSQVLYVPVEEINSAIAAHTGTDFTIRQSNGYSLNYSSSGWLWVTTPPDAEGKVYSFSWEKDF